MAKPPQLAIPTTTFTHPAPLPFSEWTALDVFGQALDGDAKTIIEFAFPTGAAIQVPGRSEFAHPTTRVAFRDNKLTFVSPKPHVCTEDQFTSNGGSKLWKFLCNAPDGTVLTVQFSKTKKPTQVYRGRFDGKTWQIEGVAPNVPLQTFQAALEFARNATAKRIVCSDDAEADGIMKAAARDEYLCDMGVTRKGLKIGCTYDDGELAALQFRYRFGEHWGIPLAGLDRKSRKDESFIATQNALREMSKEWAKRNATTPETMLGFEAIRDILKRYVKDGLAGKQTPTRFEVRLPKKLGGWDFASVALAANDVYFDLWPLGLDVALRNQVSTQMRKYAYRPDFGFQFQGDCQSFLVEIARLTSSSFEWFKREIVDRKQKPAAPCQDIDQYMIVPTGEGEVDEEDDEYDAPIWPNRTYRPLTPKDNHLIERLNVAFGAGTWRREIFKGELELPGWSTKCKVELHAYDRAVAEGGREDVRIKRFLSKTPEIAKCDVELIYAAESSFKASLEPGKTYRCTAACGRKFAAYVQIVDESGEEYWYPERFFMAVE